VPQIRKKIPDISVEGVTYGAGIAGNLTPEGGDAAGIADAKRLYNLAATKCPNTIITGGGYSQGAAITHRAVEALPDSVKQRIAGILLYGDTKHKQDGGQIKNFPKDKVKTFCNGYDDLKSASPDGVCGGALNVNAGHMSYGSTFGTAAEWLSQKVTAFKKSG
jgi:cutinase